MTNRLKENKPLKGRLIWIVNLVLFITVVFLGIEQAGRGAEIAKLEDEFEIASSVKRDLSEEIFSVNSDTKIEDLALDLGFTKPTKVYYFNSEDVFAKLPVR